jgi:hypothetical protein
LALVTVPSLAIFTAMRLSEITGSAPFNIASIYASVKSTEHFTFSLVALDINNPQFS